MKIYVDVDSTVADTHVEWFARYNKDYNDDLIPERVTRWALHDFVKPECGVKIYDYLKDPTLYDNVPEVEGAYAGVQAIKAMGRQVIFLTAGIYRAKFDWLLRHKFLESERDIVISQDKNLLRDAPLIDDYDKNLLGFSRGVLLDRPWNRDSLIEYSGSYNRAYSWPEAVEFIGRMGN